MAIFSSPPSIEHLFDFRKFHKPGPKISPDLFCKFGGCSPPSKASSPHTRKHSTQKLTWATQRHHRNQKQHHQLSLIPSKTQYFHRAQGQRRKKTIPSPPPSSKMPAAHDDPPAAVKTPLGSASTNNRVAFERAASTPSSTVGRVHRQPRKGRTRKKSERQWKYCSMAVTVWKWRGLRWGKCRWIFHPSLAPCTLPA